MRLIDADALMDDINELKKSPWYNSDINGSRIVRSEAIDIVQRLCIDDAPTIDAVDVVRCKDCKHCNSNDGYASMNPQWAGRCTLINKYPFRNWFCASGECKTEPLTERSE